MTPWSSGEPPDIPLVTLVEDPLFSALLPWSKTVSKIKFPTDAQPSRTRQDQSWRNTKRSSSRCKSLYKLISGLYYVSPRFFFYRFLLPAPLKRWRRMFWPLSRPKTQPPKTTSRKFSVGRQLLSMKTIPIFFLQRAKKCKFGTTAV